MVIRRGKIFESGDYPSHAFSMSPAELRAAVEAFAGPVPIDLEHVPTVLDGKLGHVQEVSLSADGRELHGTVHLPGWLDRLLLDGERKVSATWNRATKTLERLALVRTPRVTDAALFVAFSAEHPESIPAILAEFTDRKRDDSLSASMQSIHDHIAVNHPWACGKASMSGDVPAEFGDKPKQMKAIFRMHNDAVDHGATCPGKAAAMSDRRSDPDPDPHPSEGAVSMSKDALIKAVGALPDAPTEVTEDHVKAVLAAFAATVPAALRPAFASFAAPAPEPESPREKKLREDVEALQAQREADRKARVEDRAAAFAMDLFRTGKLLPKAVPLAADLHRELADADHDHGKTVSFGEGDARKAGGRLDLLAAFAALLPGHGLFDPAIAGDVKLSALKDADRVLFNKDGMPVDPENTPVDPEKHDRNLAMTETGRQILAQRNGKAK